MAIWQYKFFILPKRAINKIHGEIPEFIEQFMSIDKVDSNFENVKIIDYWEKESVPVSLFNLISSILNESESWDEDSRLFGDEDGDYIQVWDDDIVVSIDCRNIQINYVNTILTFCKENNFFIVEKGSGEVMSPDTEYFFKKLTSSQSFNYCVDPISTLENIKLKAP